MTKRGSSTLKKLHETKDNYIIRVYSGAEDQYSSIDNILLFNPNARSGYNENKGYYEYPFITLGHELEHADEDYRGNYFSKGRSEAKAVNAENYYRSVVLGKNQYRTKYKWGLWDKHFTSNKEDFNDYLDSNPNATGERVFRGSTEVRGDIKQDSKSSYIIKTIGTYDADSDELKNVKEGVIQYFWYKKDKNSEWEHKATVTKISAANEEKK
jgi:hypothetical protein